MKPSKTVLAEIAAFVHCWTMNEKLSPEILAEAGTLIVGPEWQTVIAQKLAPYCPRSNSQSLDPALIRRWKSGARTIPEWVRPALAHLLIERVKQLEAMKIDALEMAERLNGGTS